MAFFKPDWNRVAKIVYAVGETLAAGQPPEGLSGEDRKTVTVAAAALEHIIKGVLAAAKRYKA